jgi:hypothetical protein
VIQVLFLISLGSLLKSLSLLEMLEATIEEVKAARFRPVLGCLCGSGIPDVCTYPITLWARIASPEVDGPEGLGDEGFADVVFASSVVGTRGNVDVDCGSL